jgi:serine/threonine-protein kinase
MGTVYEAFHVGTGRRVAVKVMAKPEFAADAEIALRFQREAMAGGRLETRHIVEVLDAGRDGNVPFFAMEYLVGYDLSNLLATVGPLPPDLALRVAGQACMGLQSAHDEGIVHRDVKPANIFLAHQNNSVIVKLLDFGIAKVPAGFLSIGDDAGTTTGRLMGSPRFMSPEQARGLKTLDHRTDIWSLGAALYEALAGRPPFGDCETFGQLILAICSQPPIDLRTVAPWVPVGVARVVERTLQTEPVDRYATALEMLEDILLLLPGGVEINKSDVSGISGKRPVTPALAFSPRPASISPTPATGARRSDTPVRISDPKSPGAGSGPPNESDATMRSPGTPSPSSSDWSRSSPAVRPPKLPVRYRLAAIGTGMCAAALVAWGLTRTATPPVLVPGPTNESTQAKVPPGPPPSETVAAAPAKVLTVEIVILPVGAKVEVDGRDVDAASGRVEIRGSLGSVHAVRVMSGGREEFQEVAITEAGPVPASVRLEPAVAEGPRATVRAGSAQGTGRAAGSVPASRPSAAAPPSASAPTPGRFQTLDKTFE